jgi:hypothetical protein
MTLESDAATGAQPSWEQALATLTAADGPFALVDGEIHGVPVRLFRNAPPTLREFVQGARAKGGG